MHITGNLLCTPDHTCSRSCRDRWVEMPPGAGFAVGIYGVAASFGTHRLLELESLRRLRANAVARSRAGS